VVCLYVKSVHSCFEWWVCLEIILPQLHKMILREVTWCWKIWNVIIFVHSEKYRDNVRWHKREHPIFMFILNAELRECFRLPSTSLNMFYVNSLWCLPTTNTSMCSDYDSYEVSHLGFVIILKGQNCSDNEKVRKRNVIQYTYSDLVCQANAYTYIHTYHSRFIQGIAEETQIFFWDAHVLQKIFS
jgi:hypothetical protein